MRGGGGGEREALFGLGVLLGFRVFEDDIDRAVGVSSSATQGVGFRYLKPENSCLPMPALAISTDNHAHAQACHFNLSGALEAIKKSLTLIWRTETQIDTAIKRAFVQVSKRKKTTKKDPPPPPSWRELWLRQDEGNDTFVLGVGTSSLLVGTSCL